MKTFAVLSAITAMANAHATWQQLWKNGEDLKSTCARAPASNSPIRDYTGTDLQCNVSPSPADGKCEFEAGDTVTIEMHQQTSSRDCTEQGIGGAHWGPVLAYMSKVEDSAEADGSSEFFKVYQNTWAKNPEGSQGDDDFWGTKDLNYNCGKLDFTIPKGIAPGDYLLRAEAIALHAASTSGGAEHYVTCYQLTVSGDGTLVPKGVKFPEAYKTDGPGLGFNIHAPISEYPAPGPALIAGGTEATPQLNTFGELSGAPPAATGAASEPAASSTEASEVASSTPAAVSSSATVEAEATSAATVEVSSAIEVSSVATSIVETSSVVEVSSVAASTAETVPTEAAPVESEVAPTPTPQLSSVGPYPVVNSTSMLVGTGAPVVASSSIVVSAVPTTMATSVRPAPTAEATGPILEYYQCGGQNFKGTGECAEGLECKQWNPFYFQCVKPEATKPGPSKGPMPSSAVPVVSTPTAEAPKSSGVAAEPTVEASKPTVEAPKPTAEASKPAAEATTPTSAAPVSATPAAAEPSSAASTGDDETTEKTYTLETFIAFLEQEAGSESAAMIRRMIEALQN